MNVWDYSDRKFNLMGQICPLYSALWFLLCIPVNRLTEYMRYKFHAASHLKVLANGIKLLRQASKN